MPRRRYDVNAAMLGQGVGQGLGAAMVGGAAAAPAMADPTPGRWPGGARAQVGDMRQGYRQRRRSFLDALGTDIPGYDVGDQARAFAAAGAPPISAEFAQRVANGDPDTLAFIELMKRQGAPAATPY